MAVALLVSVTPAVAGDSFQALSRLPAGLTPLDDAQMAAVEGGYRFDFCYDCMNVAEFVLSVLAEVEQYQFDVNGTSSSTNSTSSSTNSTSSSTNGTSSSTVVYGDVVYGNITQEMQLEQGVVVGQSIN
jgi:hypothetical protein